MSASPIITYGFGIYGSVNLIATYGFTSLIVIITVPVVDYFVILNIKRSSSFVLNVNTSLHFVVNI